MKITMTAAIHARWGHRVEGLIHTHAWMVEATIEGAEDCSMVHPADDLEDTLTRAVAHWVGHYLTHEDVGPWKGLTPLLWYREPTVEEVVRQLWKRLDHELDGLIEVALVESTEFDRCRTVRLAR
jgi:6-pyruvoyl-tetrahydropterin synthase